MTGEAHVTSPAVSHLLVFVYEENVCAYEWKIEAKSLNKIK